MCICICICVYAYTYTGSAQIAFDSTLEQFLGIMFLTDFKHLPTGNVPDANSSQETS